MHELLGAAFVTPLHTRLGVYDRLHRPVGGSVRIDTDCWRPEHQLVRIGTVLKDLARSYNPGAEITEVGLAVAGQIDTRRSLIVNAGRLSGWKRVNLKDKLSEQLGGVPVYLGNDAEARTRWELVNNRTVAGKPFLTLYWGEGFGSAYVSPNGTVKPLEPGHLDVPGLKTVLRCPCGDSGHHLDAHAGGTRIGDLLNRSGKGYMTPELAGDLCEYVARTVASLLDKYPCDHIVVGGQRYKNHRRLLGDALTAALGNHTGFRPAPKLIESELDYVPVETALTLVQRSLVSA